MDLSIVDMRGCYTPGVRAVERDARQMILFVLVNSTPGHLVVSLRFSPKVECVESSKGTRECQRDESSQRMNAYPIKLTYHVRNYYFGERVIPDLYGKPDAPDGVVAETWEVSAYRDDQIDTTGTVKNGSYAKRTLRDLTTEFPEELVGQGWRGPHFPLLLKLLDASHRLPVHLHADDETARRKHGAPHGKTEAWHILRAAEGATILAGVNEGVSREELREAFLAEDYDAVMPRHEIRAGDTVYVPGGVMHTFGPDTLVFEVQQTSDLGQFVTPLDLQGNRLADDVWERNIDAALDKLRTEYRPRPNPGLILENGPNRRVVCAAGPHFALERWTLSAPYTEPAHPRRCTTLTNVGGAVGIEYEGGIEQLDPGESCILPAAIGEVRITPEGEGSLVVCYVPDLELDVIQPLREAGYSDVEIGKLWEVGL